MMVRKKILFLIAALWLTGTAYALTASQAKGIATGETDTRIEALNEAVAKGSDKTSAFIQAMADDEVKLAGDKVLIVKNSKATDPVTGADVALPSNAEDIINNNRMRGELDTALAALKLFSKDDNLRAAAVQSLLKDPDEGKLPLLDKALAAETVPALKDQLTLARAAAMLGSADKAKRLEAAKAMAGSKDPAAQLLLNDRLKAETEADVKAQLQTSLSAIQSTLGLGDKLGIMFTGLSLGSILLLAALGLAITYGLMGVINMAHGELIMIGAYATYVVQGLFRSYLPGMFDWYLIAAIPIAFLASALVGAALERSVIRFLYGRPLETLLATWGISLMLMQLVRRDRKSVV